MKNLILAFLIFLTSPAQGQQLGKQSMDQLSESPAGTRLIAFIDLINDGEELTTERVSNIFSKRLIEKYGTTVLAEMLEDVRQQDGQVTLYEANRSEKFKYDFIMKSGNTNEWMGGFVMLEKSPPYGIDGFRLDNGDRPENSERPIYGPSVEKSFAPKPVKLISGKEMVKKAESIVNAYYEMGWFSGVVLMLSDGNKLYEKAFGKADIEEGTYNTLQTKFRIGSINKDYTAVLILQEVQRGNLSLEDKLSKFKLGFPENTAEKISIRHLLNHTAGFSDIFIPAYLNNIRSYKDIDDILPLLQNEPLAYEPGTDNRYSNYGYIVLGAILEKTTGKKFSQLLDENIHSVTGCKNTDYDIAENIAREAKSYRFTVSGKKTDHTGQLEYPTPDGGMYTTANDLLTFLQVLFYSEKLLKNKYKLMLINGFQDSEMTWEQVLENPRAGFGFAGGGPGVSASVEANLHLNQFVIVLANTDRQVAEEIGQRLARAQINRKYPAPLLPPANHLYKVYKEKGKDHMVDHFKKILKDGGYEECHSGLLNSTGYSLMQENKLEQAIEMFEANVALFPKEANPYDSLGEAYLAKGDKKSALKYYKKALEIEPGTKE